MSNSLEAELQKCVKDDAHGLCRDVDELLRDNLMSGVIEMAIYQADGGRNITLNCRYRSHDRPPEWNPVEHKLRLPFDVIKMRLMIMTDCDISRHRFTQVGKVTAVKDTTRFFQPIFLVGVDGKPMIHLLFS